MPEKYEWEHCPLSQDAFEEKLLLSKPEGIGFVTVFWHVTKVFRFSPYMETILDVHELQTKELQPMDCARSDGSHEFACYAESAISADEYEAWSKAATVEKYLAFQCGKTDFPIRRNNKLAAYWK